MFSDAKSKSFNIKQVVESDEIIDDNSPINDDNNSDETTLFQKEFESDNKGKNNKSDGNNIFKTTEISPKSPKSPFIQLHKQEMPQFMTFSTVKLNKIPNMLNDIITGSNGNYSGTAKLILTPKTLGTIFVEINVHEDSVKMSIRADNHDTVKLIENSLGSLRDKIETNGVKIENLTINYYSGEHKKDTTSNRERRNDSGRRIKSDVFDIDKILFTKDTIDIKERNFQQGNYIEKYI
jgi:flagellar hook-length control protein FliK